MAITKITFELPEEKLRELEALMSECGVRTKKDLLNNALTLLEWAINEKKTGSAIASIDEKEKKYKEITMPIFSHVVKNS